MIKYLIFCCFSLMLQAQSFQLILQDSVTVDFDEYWGQDAVQNKYFSTQNTIYKVTPTNTFLYTSNLGGKLSQVECFNALHTLLFFKNTNKVVVLDNQFNEIQTILFKDIVVDFVKPASQNECWFFDSLTHKMGLYNFSTATIRWISPVMTSPIKYIYSNYNFLVWVNQNNEWFQIDKFGKIIYLGEVEDAANIIFITEKELFFTKNEQLYVILAKKEQVFALGSTKKMIKKIFYQNGILAIFTNSLLTNYKLKTQ